MLTLFLLAALTSPIQQLLDSQAGAWNRKDLEGYMAGYWKSPKMTFYSGGNVTTGFDDTLARYKKRYQGEGKQMGTLAFKDLEIDVLGPKLAYAKGRWELAMEGGKTLKGLFTVILKKLPEGWRIVHDHSSMAEDATPVPRRE
jgi:beta-aspartyl-peptidase (threonine type)